MDKWIVFDVDDVLCNFKESLYQSFKDINKDVHWSKWNTYNCVELFNLKNEKELHQHMAKYKVLENSLLEHGVHTLLQNMKDNGYHIGLLTARAWHHQGKEITEQFVHSHQLPVDRVVISGLHTDKKSRHIPKFTGRVEAYVDDSIHHIQDFINEGIRHAYLLDRPWNQSSELPRVKNLAEFEKNILSKRIKPKF